MLKLMVEMIFSKRFLIVFVSFLLSSVFIATLIDTLSFESDDFNKRTNPEDFIQITDTKDNLIWFIQISDIHLSIFEEPERILDFNEFCNHTISAINPEVVIASGDLTHAASDRGLESGQYLKEWQHYQNILKSTKLLKKNKWLDIRGNHDMFNVLDFKSRQNLFGNYSVQGRIHPKSYSYNLDTGSNSYKFLALDAGSSPGLRRNFNFIGAINSDDFKTIRELVRFKNDSKSIRKYTIWFGHFPTSCILTIGEDIREIIGQEGSTVAYLCGHLHTVYGWVPDMYTMQKSGFMELEVGDWKENRMYRVLALDHGLLSFVDLVHKDWPVILVTNPKDSRFLDPNRDNIASLRNSTHIRILAFSLAQIKSVRVKIDSLWIDCRKIDDGPLFVSKWNPSRYLDGLQHSIHVKVEDSDGRIKEIEQKFSLNHTNHQFGLAARFALMINGPRVFFYMLVNLVAITSLPLVVLRRICRYQVDNNWNFVDLFVKKLWILSKIDLFYYPMVLYPVYTLLGPWCVGFLIEDHFGVLFSWGLYINGRFMPGSFTYYWAHLFLMKFHVPFLIILAYAIDYKFHSHKSKGILSLLGYLICNFVFMWMFYKRLIFAYSFYDGYGFIATISGPLWSWSIVLVLFSWIKANCLSKTNKLRH